MHGFHVFVIALLFIMFIQCSQRNQEYRQEQRVIQIEEIQESGARNVVVLPDPYHSREILCFIDSTGALVDSAEIDGVWYKAGDQPVRALFTDDEWEFIELEY